MAYNIPKNETYNTDKVEQVICRKGNVQKPKSVLFKKNNKKKLHKKHTMYNILCIFVTNLKKFWSVAKSGKRNM